MPPTATPRPRTPSWTGTRARFTTWACPPPPRAWRSYEPCTRRTTRRARERSTSPCAREAQGSGSARYRTLAALAQSGTAHAFKRNSETVYRLCEDFHHRHLVCRSCGLILSWPGLTSDQEHQRPCLLLSETGSPSRRETVPSSCVTMTRSTPNSRLEALSLEQTFRRPRDLFQPEA
jgi:hypothetical protein